MGISKQSVCPFVQQVLDLTTAAVPCQTCCCPNRTATQAHITATRLFHKVAMLLHSLDAKRGGLLADGHHEDVVCTGDERAHTERRLGHHSKPATELDLQQGASKGKAAALHLQSSAARRHHHQERRHPRHQRQLQQHITAAAAATSKIQPAAVKAAAQAAGTYKGFGTRGGIRPRSSSCWCSTPPAGAPTTVTQHLALTRPTCPSRGLVQHSWSQRCGASLLVTNGSPVDESHPFCTPYRLVPTPPCPPGLGCLHEDHQGSRHCHPIPPPFPAPTSPMGPHLALQVNLVARGLEIVHKRVGHAHRLQQRAELNGAHSGGGQHGRELRAGKASGGQAQRCRFL